MNRWRNDKKHFQVIRPRSTHYRRATCEEVDCPEWKTGWKTIVPTLSDDADFIRHSLKSAYRFTEHRVEAGMSEFVFAAGQPCFRASTHKVDIERTPIFRRGKDVPYFTRTGKQLYLTDPRYFESGRVEPHQWLDELHEATDMNIQEV